MSESRAQWAVDEWHRTTPPAWCQLRYSPEYGAEHGYLTLCGKLLPGPVVAEPDDTGGLPELCGECLSEILTRPGWD